MSDTRYLAIFNHWYIAYTHLYIKHTPCTCRVHGIRPYSTIDTYLIHIYTSDIHPAHVVYTVLGHIKPFIHSLYTFIHQTYTLYMSYTRYWAIFNHWYIAYTVLYIRHSTCTCHIRSIGPHSTIDTYLIHFYTSEYALHMSYARHWAIFNHWWIAYTLLHITHSRCTCRIHFIGPYSTSDTYPLHFIHQTFTLHMSYTWYWAIFNHWYIAYTHLYIKHTPCTCRIHGIGPYSTSDTYPLHFYTSDIHNAHVVYTVLGHIQPLIHSLYTFIHQTFTLHMSYTYYLAIFNHWYIAYTLLYIRHTPCTCRIPGIGPYTNGDTCSVHIFTSDIHPVHVVYTVLGHIQPLIHSLYTFIHQTFNLHMSYTRYWAIFNRWYIPSTLLYIWHSPCTCRTRGIGPYSTIDT